MKRIIALAVLFISALVAYLAHSRLFYYRHRGRRYIRLGDEMYSRRK